MKRMLQVDYGSESPSRVPPPANGQAVPVMDLECPVRAGCREEIATAVQSVAGREHVLRAWGRRVTAFEEAFAAYLGARHCVGVNSGTSALHLALICAGVGPGDEVITVPMTFIATAWAISYVGCHAGLRGRRPGDVHDGPGPGREADHATDAGDPAGAPVRPAGGPGAAAGYRPQPRHPGHRGRRPVARGGATAASAGTFGVCGCFSFYPGKNLGAYGEAGAIVTNDDATAKRMRMLRDHAQEQRYHHEEIGFNYRMDGIQGAVLGVKLKYLEAWTEARRAGWPTATGRGWPTCRCSLPTEARAGGTSGTCTSSCTASATGSAASSRRAASRPGCTTRSHCTCRRLTAPRPQGRRFPRRRAGGPRVPDPAALPGDDRRAAGPGGRTAGRVSCEEAEWK